MTDPFAVAEHPNVIVALAHARHDIGAIGKSRQVTQGANFAYRGIEDVLNAANQVLATNGITITPVLGEWDRVGISKGQGNSWHRTTGEVFFDVYGPAGVDDKFRGSVLADADDNGDKGAGKLHSYAYKTFVIELLTIPTADMMEDNESTAPQGDTAPPQRRGRGTKQAAPPRQASPSVTAAVFDKIESATETQKADLRAFMKAAGLKLTKPTSAEAVVDAVNEWFVDNVHRTPEEVAA